MKKNYSISIPHFYCLEYMEDEKKLILDIDFRDPGIYLSIDLIDKWEKPYDTELISVCEKKRILKNIYSYLIGRGHSGIYLVE